jgi:hypothetical protein
MPEDKKKKTWTAKELDRFKQSLVAAECRSVKELEKSSQPWRKFRKKFGPLRSAKYLQKINQAVTGAFVEDWYDWSRGDYAFTSPETAIEFCRRHERHLVEKCRSHHDAPEKFLQAFLAEGAFQVPPREKYPEYAHCKLWTSRKNDLAWFILNPATRREQTDHEQIVEVFGFGTLWDNYLHQERMKATAGNFQRDCWCAKLRAGKIPKGVEFVHVMNFKFSDEPCLFVTDQHDGSVRRGSCKVCGGLVLSMFVNEPGFGDSGHHYYSFPGEDELPGLNAANYEAYVSSHCGIHADGWYCRFYDKIKVYTIFELPE